VPRPRVRVRMRVRMRARAALAGGEFFSRLHKPRASGRERKSEKASLGAFAEQRGQEKGAPPLCLVISMRALPLQSVVYRWFIGGL
jgi:hypothetical protein